jgi:hypothetical protein
MKKHFIISLSITLVFILAIGFTLNKGMAQTSTSTASTATSAQCRNLTSNFYYQMDGLYSSLYSWASWHKARVEMETYSNALTKYRADVSALHRILEAEGFSVAAAEKSSRDIGFSTASAISGLQEKYKAQILTPQGLTYPTGIVDRATREFLNQKYGCIEKAKIDITSPSTSVIRGKGEIIPIKWTASRIPNTTTLNINYVKEDGTGTTTITTQTIRNGSGAFDWTIPQNITVGKYRIQATLSGSISSDTSRALFEIRENTIEVSAPAGGQDVSVGQRVTITWRTGTGVTSNDNVSIQLVNDPSSTTSSPSILNIATVKNSGSYTWVVPEKIGVTNIANNTNYRILVSSTKGFSGYNPNPFKISNVVVTKPTITITAPLAQSIVRGQSVDLRWSSLNIPASARMSIRLVPNGSVGATSTLESNVSVSSGSRSVTIPASTPAGDYRLEVVSPGVGAESPSVLRSPVLTVTQQSVSLNINTSGTTSVVKGGTIPVRWTGSGIASNANVTIELINSTNSALVSGTRITRAFSVGSSTTPINLSVPSNIPNGSYKVKISATADSRTLTSESAVITIASASIGFSTSTVPTITVAKNSRGSSTEMVARFVMNLDAIGGAINKPVVGNPNPAGSNFKVNFIGPNGVEIPATSYTVSMSPDSGVAVGKTGRVTIVARVPASSVATGGQYRAYIRQYELSLDRQEKIATFPSTQFVTPAAVTFVK